MDDILAQVVGNANDLIDRGDLAGARASLEEMFTQLQAGEIEELVGPIALYPDDLLAIVLPASTYPLQVVEAGRFLEELESDATLEPNEGWDDSIVALLNYPEVVEMLNDDLDWTWRLGEAVVNQQSDVIAAIESFRDLHWDIRPHGDLGTLELRVLDAQIDAHRIAQIASLVRALVVVAADPKLPDSAFPARLPHWMEIDNHFRACKSGLDAQVIVAENGDTTPMMQVVESLFDLVRSRCECLGDSELLAGLERSLKSRNGAELQRSAWRQHHSCRSVARFLVEALHHPTSLRATA